MWFKENVGVADTALRSVVAVVLGATAFEGSLGQGASLALYGVAAILSLTAITGVCPLYRLIGLDTFKAGI